MKLSVLIGLAALALLVGFAIGSSFSERDHATGEQSKGGVPQLDDGVTFDPGSIAYVGSFRDATFWSATKGEGETACFIVEDPLRSVAPSATACERATVTSATTISFGTTEVGRRGELVLIVFELRASQGEDPIFSVTRSEKSEPRSVSRRAIVR